jgi:predicted secreted protein
MGRILELEQPPPALRQRLVDAFNAGFESGRAAYPACSEDSRAAAAAAARSAAAAARNLSDHAAEL